MKRRIVFTLLLLCAGCQFDQKTTGTVSMRTEITCAVAEAKAHLLSIGCGNVDDDIIAQVDEANSLWLAHVASSPDVMKMPAVKSMNLNQANYWAVYFHPKSGGKGGDGFVFIDKTTGRIIGTILGE